MNKIIYILLLLLYCANGMSQTYNDFVKENEKLTKKLEDLNARKSEMQQKIKDTEKSINVKRDELAKLENRIEDKALTKKVSQVAEYHNQINELDKEINKLNTEIEQLKGNIDNAERNLHETEEDKRLGDEMIEKNKEDLKKEIESYIQKNFAQIDKNKLRAFKEKCIAYKDEHVIESEITEKLDSTLKKKEIYDNAVSLLGKHYYKNSEVEEACRNLEILKASANDAQKKDVDSVLDRFSNYKKGISVFKELIKKAEPAKKEYKNKFSLATKNPTLMKKLEDKTLNTVMTADLKNKVDKYIKPYPYLNEKYNAYWNALRQNSAASDAIEKEIKGLITD